MKIVTLKKVLVISTLLGSFLILVILLSMTMGSVKVKPLRSILILLQSLLGLKGAGTETEKAIILSLRFPRALLAGLVGAGLSVSGAIFQALLRNPLADPYILGVSSGAAVGAIVAILMGLGTLSFGLPMASFVGAFLTIIVVFYFGRQDGKIHPNTLLLAGVIVSSFLSALIMFFISISQKEELHTIIFWLMGDFSFSNYQAIGMIFPLYFIRFPCSFLPRSPVQSDPFWRRECSAIGSGCGEIEVDLLPLCFFDHRCICLGVRSDRFCGADRSPFGSVGLRT